MNFLKIFFARVLAFFLILFNLVAYTQSVNAEENTSTSSGSGSGSGTSSSTVTPTYYDNSSSGSGSSYNLTPTPSPGTGESTSFQTQTSLEGTDRLAKVDENTLNCIKTRLSEYEFERLRFLVPVTENEYKEFENLKEKASICFESFQEATEIEKASIEVQEISQSTKECLLSRLGEIILEEINSGKRSPTNEERKIGESCFNESGRPKVVYQTEDQELESDVRSCLVLALDERKVRRVKLGNENLTLEERGKVERCFGVSPHPLSSHPEYKLPEEINLCLSGKIGEGEIKKIRSGNRVPTDIEIKNGKNCFDKINKIQTRLLPGPPDQVPFLAEDSTLIKVKDVSQNEIVVSEGITEKKLVLRGSGLSNSLVDIYIFSEPVVVATETDVNGDWVYELDYPIEEGKHVAYATVRAKDGNLVRSSVFDFQVLASENDKQSFLRETQVSNTTNKFLIYAAALISLSILTAFLGGVYLIQGNKKEEKPY